MEDWDQWRRESSWNFDFDIYIYIIYRELHELLRAITEWLRDWAIDTDFDIDTFDIFDCRLLLLVIRRRRRMKKIKNESGEEEERNWVGLFTGMGLFKIWFYIGLTG